MSRKKISTTIYVTPEQSDKLKLLHERTKVPVAVYIREGIDLVLRHYGHLLPGQLPLDGSTLLGQAARPAERAETRARGSAPDLGDGDDFERRAPSATATPSASHAGHSAHAASKK
jgi:hypothetical protein